MRILLLITSIALLSVAFTSTTEKKDEKPISNHDPASFKEMTIEFYDGGGMFPESERIFISNDSVYYKHYLHGEETRTHWAPTMSELEELHLVFTKNNYAKIESELSRGTVYDLGGAEFTITIDGEIGSANNNGSRFVKEKWRANFQTIRTAISNYAASKLK
ncbi:MAG: hypothetical protein P8I55_04015 [Crocinitomix sp.]|nr:hypothetical protein [Crocinitomix sp.]